MTDHPDLGPEREQLRVGVTLGAGAIRRGLPLARGSQAQEPAGVVEQGAPQASRGAQPGGQALVVEERVDQAHEPEFGEVGGRDAHVAVTGAEVGVVRHRAALAQGRGPSSAAASAASAARP